MYIFINLLFFPVFQQLAEAEERHRALLARSQDLPVPVMMVKNVHTLMAGALGDLGTKLATYYVAEMVKFMTAMIAHVNSGGPLPRFTLEPPASHFYSHPHTTPVAGPSHYEAMQPPPAHMSRPPSRQSAPSTPKSWQSRAPTHGKPEATAVTPRDYLPDISHEFQSYFASLEQHDLG